MSKRSILLPISLLLLVNLSCSIPGLGRTPEPGEGTQISAGPTPTPLPPPPPTLVETYPPPGVELSLNGAITLYFDQPMDRPSVEGSLQLIPIVEVELEWLDDQTLRILPLEPFQRAQEYRVSIGVEAHALTGLTFVEPISIKITTIGNLEITRVLPAPGASEVNSDNPITIVFNRPVIPLKVEGDLPSPLIIDPPVPGHGEWIDTSIFSFRPEPQFPGGTTFTVRVESGLTDLAGGILDEPFTWSFSTAMPAVVSIDPVPFAQDVARDEPMTLAFNQKMNSNSVKNSFTLTAPGQVAIDGTGQWNDDHTQFIFTPDELLQYNVVYNIHLSASALSAGGSSINAPLRTSFTTLSRPVVISSSPSQGGQKSPYTSVEITFNAPMDQTSLLTALDITPHIENLGTYWHGGENRLMVFGDYQPSTTYKLTLSQEAVDSYDTPIPEPFHLNFTTSDLSPRVSFTRFSGVLTLTEDGPQQVEVNHRNTSRIDLELYQLSMGEFFDFIQSGFYGRADPKGELLRQWHLYLAGKRNTTHVEKVQLSQTPLPSGAYLLILDSPQATGEPEARLLIVRQIELVIKSTTEEAFIWAVDLRDGQPVSSHPVSLLDETGAEIARGMTDGDGVVVLDHTKGDDPYSQLFAQSGEPGEDSFGMSADSWSHGIHPYIFGVEFDTVQPEYEVYLYTDRPIYRPGQTVRFRGVLRQTDEARYLLPDMDSVELIIRDSIGEVTDTQTTSLTPFGSFNGEFALAAEVSKGTFSVETEYGSVFFDVAEYRKPEYSVTIEPSATQIAAGEQLTAEIQAKYFFGGAVDEAEVQWVAWLDPFYPPNLPHPIDWFNLPIDQRFIASFETYASGEGFTNSNGILHITLPTTLEDNRPARMTIEASLTDSTGIPVTGRTTVDIHPATIYLSLIPERYTVRAGERAVVKLMSVDWTGDPIAKQEVEILIERMTWHQITDDEGRLSWEWDADLVNQETRATHDDGSLSVYFTPEKGGTYRVTSTGTDPVGRPTTGQLTLWVAGQGSGVWRQPASGRLALVPDREAYSPGDTAYVLVPSPYQEATTALITIERGDVLSHQIIQVEDADAMIEIPIEELHAPNIYLSVVLIRPTTNGDPASIAVGIVELPVAADALALNVTLTPDRSETEPGKIVTYQLEAQDAQGQPVQAEFTFALADLAALSLTEPNSPSPFDAFYGHQPLRVITGASLAVSGVGAWEAPTVDGIGGGGGDVGVHEVRREFPDTAYWNASVITDSDGLAQVTLTLPDSLTTWRMDARGVTKDTQVGSGIVDLIATKDLLIRPVTPRFFTAGDAASVAAVVHNNTARELTVDTQLAANGADITTSPTHSAVVSGNSQMRFDWSLNIHDVDIVDLTFHVSGGGLQDASKPTIGSTEDGALPVLRYSAPDTVSTTGVLEDVGERLEIINLPRRYDATQGDLSSILDPSLGSAIETALDVLKDSPYLSTECVVSRFLPNLAVYRALQELDLDEPSFQAQLEQTLIEGMQTLHSRQQSNGGWGWWSNSPSNPYLTAYVLYGLAQAKQAGVQVGEHMTDSAVQYLLAGVVPAEMLKSTSEKNRQVFVLYSLAAAGSGDLATSRRMAAQRGELSLWARALLAQTLHMMSPVDDMILPLLSDFEATAIRSATGAHWEDEPIDRWNMGSRVRTTAHILRTLISLDGDNPLIPRTVRWILASRSRNGAWSSTHETTWALLALTDWLVANDSWRPDYEYSLSLNGITLASGSATPNALFSSVELKTPVSELLSDQPNQLVFGRGAGPGSLYYTAHLTVYRPIEEAQATSRGFTIQRQYFHYDGICGGLEDPCQPAYSATVGEDLLVRVSLVIPSDQYYVVVEDPYPAGAEPIDTQLLTTPTTGAPPELIQTNLLRNQWGWWRFTRTEFGDDHMTLFADYLPAGTYHYYYVLHTTLPGEYRVRPPRAWALYFPEVYGQGEGRVYTIRP
jgi:uncharacterized protein YfaS (alpha-2-macroglobulin family)